MSVFWQKLRSAVDWSALAKVYTDVRTAKSRFHIAESYTHHVERYSQNLVSLLDWLSEQGHEFAVIVRSDDSGVEDGYLVVLKRLKREGDNG